MDTKTLRELLAAATPRAPHYAHPESDRAKATRALDAAVRHALPALLDRLDALEAVAQAARELCAWDWGDALDQGKRGDDVRDGMDALDAALAALRALDAKETR